MLLGSILDNGAVYYPLLFGIPVIAGIVVAWKELPFFVVVGLILFGLAAFVRWFVLRLRRPGRAGE